MNCSRHGIEMTPCRFGNYGGRERRLPIMRCEACVSEVKAVVRKEKGRQSYRRPPKNVTTA